MSATTRALGCTFVCAIVLLRPAPLRAQRDSASLDSLARVVSIASARFADRRVASANGYRRIGPDFPGMGEHWLNAGVLLAGTVDAEHPALLIYADLHGAPTLLGVGFVATTRADEALHGAPGWPDAWHEHSGLLSDESGVSPGTKAPSDTHVWVLHVWTRLANTGGRFAADNWALPFERAGLRAPSSLDVDAARALSLLSGGDVYLRDLLSDARLRTEANAGQVDSVLTRTRTRVGRIASTSAPSRTLSADALAALRDEWSSLERSLGATLGVDVARYLAPPHMSAGAAHHHEASR